MEKINQTDKVFIILTIFSFTFWVLAKIPIAYEFLPFNIFYYTSWLVVCLLAITCTLYFLYKWIKNRFVFSKIHFYGFLLGLITLIIMRFIY